MRSLTKFSIASAVMLALAVPAAQASHIIPFTGHTDLVSGGTWSGTNNFTVIDLTVDGAVGHASGLAPHFVAGVGSAAFPGLPTSGYLYLYQPTNDAGSTVALAQFTNSIGALGVAAPTVYGHFAGRTMGDLQGDVSAANDLDVNATFSTSGGVGQTAPTSVTLNLATRSIIASYSALPAGGTSDLIGFISSAPPGWFTGSLQNGGAAVGGRSPAPAPAPAAALLGVLGLGLVGVARKFRLG
jgi:hypothetical protein